MLKNKILFYPILLFFFLFLIDKIFLLESVKKYIKSDFTHIYYETREAVFESIVNDPEILNKEKKFMLILGSSRLLYFDAEELKQYYPNWKIYNLSSAVTTPSYYYYYVEKLLKAGVHPDVIILESDPNQFNANSPVFRGSNLTYSFDLPFILRYSYLFGRDNVSFYLAKSLFAISKNKPYLDKAVSRMRNPNFESIATMQEVTRNFLIQNRGNALSLVDQFVEKNYWMLETTSKRTLDWVYAGYRPSEMQYEFYEMILQDLSKTDIDLLIVWPQSSPPMQKLLKNSSFTGDWQKKIGEINGKYGYTLLDMDESQEYRCNTFVDGGHIAKDCYRPFIRYIMSEYYKDKNSKN